MSPFGALAFESPDARSFLSVFVSFAVASCKKRLSDFDLWLSWTRDTVAPEVLDNFSDNVQMGRERHLPGGLLSGN